MRINTNKYESHITIDRTLIECLTNEELGELIRIGYLRSSTKEFFRKTVNVYFLDYVLTIRDLKGKYQNIFKNFDTVRNMKNFENDIYLQFSTEALQHYDKLRYKPLKKSKGGIYNE